MKRKTLISTKKVSELLGVTRSSISRMILRGDIRIFTKRRLRGNIKATNFFCKQEILEFKRNREKNGIGKNGTPIRRIKPRAKPLKFKLQLDEKQFSKRVSDPTLVKALEKSFETIPGEKSWRFFSDRIGFSESYLSKIRRLERSLSFAICMKASALIDYLNGDSRALKSKAQEVFK